MKLLTNTKKLSFHHAFEVKADISTLQKSGHFYFALTQCKKILDDCTQYSYINFLMYNNFRRPFFLGVLMKRISYIFALFLSASTAFGMVAVEDGKAKIYDRNCNCLVELVDPEHHPILSAIFFDKNSDCTFRLSSNNIAFLSCKMTTVSCLGPSLSDSFFAGLTASGDFVITNLEDPNTRRLWLVWSNGSVQSWKIGH